MKLASYRSPKTHVKTSPIHGNGLFALALIKKDEIIAIKGGHIIDSEMLSENSEVIRHSELQIADIFYIANMNEEEFEDVMIFYNHSCDPNMGFLGNIISVAMRDIQIGEEIVTDYAMWQNNNVKFKCTCRYAKCRKLITGRDWMNKELQDKYGDYMQAYLFKKIKEKVS